MAAAGDTIVAEVVLKNLTPISGISWTVGFEPTAMTPLEVEKAERTETMEIYFHTAGDSLRVLMLDPELDHAVPPGAGTIARMRFRLDSAAEAGDYPLRLIQADLGDDARPPERLEPVRVDGEVTVTGFVVRTGQAEGFPGDTVAVALMLQNPEPAAGLQAELAWAGEVLTFVDAASGGRADHLSAYGASRNAGGATLLLADLSGVSPLPAGEGVVLWVRVRIGEDAAVGAVPLEIVQALLPDPDGISLPVVMRSGTIEVMFRPNRSPELVLPEFVFAVEDSDFAWPIPASDPDGDVLSYTLASAPGWLAVDAQTGLLDGMPGDADVGIHEVQIRISDGEAEAEGTLWIEVLNRAPEIVGAPPLNARVGAWYQYTPEVGNLDGGSIRLETEAEGVALDDSTGAFQWRPAGAGEVAFSLIAVDPHGAEAVQTFVVRVETRPEVVIDEILADPPSGLEGDANGDGVRDSKADEFVELLNLGPEPVDLGGWTLSDDDVSEANRFRFPEGVVLASGERAVLFGGGQPAGIAGSVFTDDGSIGNGLTNSGDVVLLIDPAFADTMARLDYQIEGDLNASLVRQEDGDYAPHDSFPGNGRFSPGRPRPVLEWLEVKAPDSLRVGARGELRAVAHYSDGIHREVTEAVAWDVDPAYLEVEENRELIGISAGRTEISAVWHAAVAGREIVVVERPNQFPVVAPVSLQTVPEDSTFQVDLVASDPDGDVLSFDLVSGPAWLAIDEIGGLSGRPADPDVGQAGVVVGVSDGRARVEVRFEIEVLNRPPEIVGAPLLQTRVGVRYQYTPEVGNLDGGSIRLETEAEGVTLDDSTGAFQWRPAGAGEVAFSLIAVDPHGAEAVQTFVVRVETRPEVVIDEILADPASGPEGDANGDGVRDSKADEFVELLNLGPEPVDIGGWMLSDDDVSEEKRFRFPEGTILEPGERAVVFGGEEPVGIPGPVFTDDGSIGNGLTNSGDVVLLIDPAFSDTVALVGYRTEGDLNAALARQEGGDYTPHDAFPGNGRFSPGRPRPVLERWEVIGPDSLRMGARGVLRAFAFYSDGAHREVTEEVTWHPDETHLKLDENGEVTGISPGRARISGVWHMTVARLEITVVEGLNRVPVVAPVPMQTALEDSTFQVDLVASDPDGDVLSFDLVSGPAWLAIDEIGRLSGRPGDPDVGRVQVVVAVYDGRARLKVRFEVEVINRPPEIAGTPSLRTRVGATYRYSPEIHNLDGGQVRLETEAERVAMNALNGEITWRPTGAGEVALTLVAADPHGAEAVQSFVVRVQARPEVIIDEILADPPPGPEGDANGDGVRDSKTDEFVELLNLGAEPVDIGGWTLSDDDVSESGRFRFPQNTALGPGERAVLFGGGEPAGIPGLVFTDDGSIGNGLTNSGDVVLLIDPVLGDTLAQAAFEVDGDLNQSLVRENADWVAHGAPPGQGFFSPGRPRDRIDLEEAQYEQPSTVRRPEGVVINEILADPAFGPAGDANRDGVRDGFEDEFVELWNSGGQSADLSGWRLGDDDVGPERLFQFPAATILPAGEYLTLFGGGRPQGVPGLVFVDDGRIGDGLSNAGDRVLLVSADGADTLGLADYEKGRSGISWSRGEEDALIEHDRLPGKGPLSPGYARAVLVALRTLPDTLRLALGAEAAFRALGDFSDGTEADLSARVRWTLGDSTVARVDSAGQVLGLAEGRTALTVRWDGFTSDPGWIEVGPSAGEGADSTEVDQHAPFGPGGMDTLAVEDSTGVSVPVSHGPITGNGGAEGGPGLNLPPTIFSSPDTVALVGLRYRYQVKAEDPDGDSALLRSPVRPDWLALEGGTLEGVPLPEDAGYAEVVVEADDGQDRSEQRFHIRVLSSEDLLGGAPDSVAYVGLTWRWPLVLQGEFEIQVEGGPALARSPRALVWRPGVEDEGERIVAVSVSGHGLEELVKLYRVRVLPGPHLEVTEILVDPPEDVDGDGVVDAMKDQFIELRNAGGYPVDVSGWTFGDDDGMVFQFPEGATIPPRGLFTLFGGGQTDVGAGRFSAGGRIGNGLAASDRILLIAPSGPDTLIDIRYSGGKVGASLVPDPNRKGRWIAHSTVSDRLFSPGTPEAVPPMEVAGLEEQPAEAPGELLEAGSFSEHNGPTPNPFNRSTTVGFHTDGGEVRLTVFSVLGQPVRRLMRGNFPPGRHRVVWDGRNDRGRAVGSGVYLICIETGQDIHTMRVLLLQ